MMARTKRVQRVESEMLQILALRLQQNLGQPLPCYASITAVEASPDLRNARVYFRLLGEDAAVAEGKRILVEERAQFQRQVARELNAKFCPILKFEFGVAQGAPSEIDKLLENLRRPRGFED